jgi:hypothetical protein
METSESSPRHRSHSRSTESSGGQENSHPITLSR